MAGVCPPASATGDSTIRTTSSPIPGPRVCVRVADGARTRGDVCAVGEDAVDVRAPKNSPRAKSRAGEQQTLRAVGHTETVGYGREISIHWTPRPSSPALPRAPAAMSAVSPLSVAHDGDRPSSAVEVREPVDVDEEAEAEANEIRDAMAKLQRLVSPTPLLDAEVDSRRADAERLTEASIAAHGGRAYKSPYHDAHHTTLVAAAAALTRALGDGPAGSGFMSDVAEAENLVRDATHMIANAARDALRRDQGELPRLYDICVKLRRDRDEARAATRRLVLAFGREKREKASRDRRAFSDAIASARDEAVRQYIEDKAEVLNRQRAHEEELLLLQAQLREAREAPTRRIQMLEHALASERAARGRDFEANNSAIAALNDRVTFAEARAADLRNQLGSAKHDMRNADVESAEKLDEEKKLASVAVKRAEKCRDALASAKKRAARREAFRLWRLRVSCDVASRAAAKEAERTVRAVKNGYEIQLERTQHLCDLAVARANKRAEAAEVAATGRARRVERTGAEAKKGADARDKKKRNADGAENDPWSFLGDGAREKASALAGPESADRAARERAALEAADARIRKVDAYYARVKKRGEADLARTAESEAEFFASRRVLSETSPSPSPIVPDDVTRRIGSRFGGDGGGSKKPSSGREAFRDEAVAAAAAVLVQGAVANIVGRNASYVETLEPDDAFGASVPELVREGRLVSEPSGAFEGSELEPAATAPVSVPELVREGRLKSQRSGVPSADELNDDDVE